MSEPTSVTPDPKTLRQHKDLADAGWVPGDYMFRCIDCSSESMGGKTARRCRGCAERRVVNEVDQQPQLPSSNPRMADTPRDVLLGKTLRQRAHQLRIEACSAWSNVVQHPIPGLDEAKCDYARAIEERLRAVIDELADLSSPVETPVNGMSAATVAEMLRVEACVVKLGTCMPVGRFPEGVSKYNALMWAAELIEERCAVKAPAEPAKVCTCTPSSSGGNERCGWIASGKIDPNCPIHWQQALIHNSSAENGRADGG